MAVTASAFEEDRQKILACGCDDFIRKPYRDSEIYDAMAKHLGLEYVYEENRAVGPAASKPQRLATADLAELPPEMIAELRRAALRGSVSEAKLLLEKIGADHPEVAQKLTSLISTFDWESILRAADAFKEQKTV